MLMKYLSTLNEPFIFEHSATGLYCFTQNKKTVTAKTTEELYRKIKPLRYEDLTMYQLYRLASALNGTNITAGQLPDLWQDVQNNISGNIFENEKARNTIRNIQEELRGN